MPKILRPVLSITFATLAAALIVLFAGALGGHPTQALAQEPNGIVRAFSVGGVLTADGTLWQYLPDKKRWYTVDEAFRAQGKETRILPLPIPVDQILDISTWGFLVSTSGTCWLYDIEANKWTSIPPPAPSR